MKYMVEFHVKPGQKEKMLERFERIGPNREVGVKFRGAWIGIRSDVIFVLAESEDESRVAAVAQSWSAHADATVHAVIDIEQI
ncbi:MAG: DUF3303 family protein [Planctomycetaceae bacterium]|nr:DUF3303 family protein [Planctomycetaceae bacterium]